MNIYTSEISSWVETLEDFSQNYAPVKVWSVLQYYTLAGRKSVISKENIIPILDLKYAVFSPAEKRYYIKEFRGYPLDVLFFHEPDITWNSWDSEINSIRRYIDDGNLYIIFTQSQVADTTAMLIRVFKAHFSGDGKVSYKTWIKLLNEILTLENYKGYAKNHTGFKTVCKMAEERINALWESTRKN